ncbi:ABC transporter ATP-binding protein [Corynebacterium frankenforstense]|uniref:ABC transporter ATP-binding protein n=1 Tax=Corynebacterium frankenforstense TaxID=1230998 RepID=UPI0026EE3B4B|nr:ABC transporter ATP-binding protein [Corynebacterium frankenforstense]
MENTRTTAHEPLLVARDITKDYGSGPVLGGISLSVRAGETVAIMGPSGSGKSTLLHCLSGVLQPSTGEVRFAGAELSAAGDRRRSRIRLHDFGFVFQDGQLLDELTAAENVALAARLAGTTRAAAEREAVDLLSRLGVGGLADRRPAAMSGGQAQRVAIARALANSPQVVFADEPTGALDQATGHEVIQLLTALTAERGASLVMVTHDRGVADWCGRLVEIRDGIVHADRSNR